MPITVTCTCGAQFRVKDEHAGRQAKCPHCAASMTIPGEVDEDLGDEAEVEDYPEDGEEPLPATGASRKRRSWFGGSSSVGSEGTLLGMNRTCGTIMLLAGLVMVLVSRGCSTIAGRAKSRADAKYELLQNVFDDKQAAKQAKVEESLSDLNDDRTELQKQILAAKTREERTALQERMTELQKSITKEGESLKKIQSDGAKKRRGLQRGEWRDQYESARDSFLYKSTGSYWREWIFVVGTVILAVGLLTVGFAGQGAERTICLIMIAIITFSLYIGGIAWLDSIFDAVDSTRRPTPRINQTQPDPRGNPGVRGGRPRIRF